MPWSTAGVSNPGATVRSVDPTVRFVELVNSPAKSIDLTLGALLLSAHASPGLDIDAQAERIDALAEQCGEPTLDGLRRLLFDELGFAGDADDYYAPENSLLDVVLDRRRGLPITLSLVAIEVGRRLGVPLDGVGMPGHFLVRDRVLRDVFMDPFANGRLLTTRDCEAIFRQIAGASAPFDPSYLDPVPDSVILSRMAANLVNAYERADDRYGLRWAARLRMRCPGVAPPELARLGDLLAHTGAFGEAGAALTAAAEAVGEEQGTPWKHKAQRHYARLN